MKRTIRSVIMCALLVCMFFATAGVSKAAVRNPRLNLKKLNLTKSTTFTLRVYNLDEDVTASFKSSDSDVVRIASTSDDKRSCVIVGKAVGKAFIKVTIKNKDKVIDTLKCRITVSPVPVSIKFSDNSVTMTEGNQGYIGSIIELIIKPYSATEQPVFESSNEDVAVINTRGLITALEPGTATITATLVSTGKKASFKVIVKKDPNDD